jgi:hypothetical protein
MRILTPYEIQHVSGAGFFDFIGSVVIGAVAGITAFGLKWAMSGGSTGGIIGAGVVGGAGGLVIGAAVGLINGVLYGAINGWDTTTGWFNQIVENHLDMNVDVVTA